MRLIKMETKTKVLLKWDEDKGKHKRCILTPSLKKSTETEEYFHIGFYDGEQ